MYVYTSLEKTNKFISNHSIQYAYIIYLAYSYDYIQEYQYRSFYYTYIFRVQQLLLFVSETHQEIIYLSFH